MKGNVLITECTPQLKMYRDNSWSILFNLYPLTHFPRPDISLCALLQGLF